MLKLFKYTTIKLNKDEKNLLLPVTFSGAFEWFEFFLFIYWSKIFESQVNIADISFSIEELIYAILLLATGLFSRPIGGIIFGLIGDKFGRKKAFIFSIITITIPSIILTFAPSFPAWTYTSLIYLGIMRLFQGIPAGGELPGALCLLYEGSESPERKKYLCSFLFIGPQLGQILSVILITILQSVLTNEQLFSWGWRVSFGISSCIGLTAALLRKKLFKNLHESTEFQHLEKDHKIEPHPLRKSFKFFKIRMITVLFLTVFEVTGFFLIYYYFFERPQLLNLDKFYGNLVYLLYLLLLTITMPIFGSVLNEKKMKELFKISAFGVIFLSFPVFLAIQFNIFYLTFILLNALIVLFCIQFSLLPSFIAGLFPSQVRFSCIGFSFNITDGVIGGLIPFLAAWLTAFTGHSGTFVIIFPVTALIFLFCLKITNKWNYSYG